jgi:hypothetical protein
VISTITDEVLAEVERWQQRPLDAMYPIVYFDALRLKIRDDGTVRNKAVFLAWASAPMVARNCWVCGCECICRVGACVSRKTHRSAATWRVFAFTRISLSRKFGIRPGRQFISIIIVSRLIFTTCISVDLFNRRRLFSFF